VTYEAVCGHFGFHTLTHLFLQKEKKDFLKEFQFYQVQHDKLLFFLFWLASAVHKNTLSLSLATHILKTHSLVQIHVSSKQKMRVSVMCWTDTTPCLKKFPMLPQYQSFSKKKN